MIQTASAEQAWWGVAGPENIWGLGGGGVDDCLEAIGWAIDGLTPGSRVLDLGCGPGRLTIPLAHARPALDFIGLDVRDYSQDPAPNVRWVLGDGRIIPTSIGRLDAAYSIALLQHLPHDATRNYLIQLALRLCPGGRIVLQHVLGDEDSFLSHQIHEPDLVAMCEDSDLRVVSIVSGILHFQWVWVYAERRA